MSSNLQLCCCLMLLTSVALASLVENQASSLERAPSLVYKGSRLRCYKYGDARIVQPFVAMQLPSRSRVLRDPLGNGYYFNVPLKIVSHMKLPKTSRRQWHMFQIKRFKVQMRQPACKSKCPQVSVLAEWRKGDSPVVRFSCKRRSICRRLLQSLRFKGERSRSLRASLRFTFFGQAKDMQFSLSRVSLPIINAATRPYPKEFWFEGDKLVLYTIKANIGVSAYKTYTTEQNYPAPRDGSLPDVYRSHLVDQMATVASTGSWEIVAEMRKAGRTVAQLVFDGNPRGLNKLSWFSKERLISSRPFWIGHTNFNFFSVAGHAAIKRYFFVNYHYAGCPGDIGAFMVSDKKDPCPWANQYWRGKTPVLVYSAYQNVRFQSGSARSADNFLVYMRFKRPSSSSAPAISEAFEFEPSKILLFTVKANSNQKAAATFLNSAIKSRVPKSGNLPSVFRSELIDSLSTLNARTGKHYIVAEMRAGSRMVAQVVFDISTKRSKLNKENWFSKERVVSSYPYPVGSKFNYFSIRGHAAIKRSFFISFSYHGCPGDRAFWMVSDGRDPCPWANAKWSGRSPALIYTKSRRPLLQKGGAQHDADRFLVYLK
ncbi:hypothetical protein BOX15_Mlig034437g1 [Macrostomum lignano]|uniref:Amine oxidase n=2 Tax=Macrostomum lignano TaxID=282301 RepID=A0A1I8H7U4_9PLAT|nr:hypothetical protein BOX15_Mlig034437g2 [Macrostomum lignano]PAA59281.1 hypothetical protein BOX15_Mlig034437g1 [Macrostomum lignano]